MTIGRGTIAIFLGVVALAAAQVAWWTVLVVRLSPDRRHVTMIASEGAFFMAILLLGVFLIYRTLAEQVRLRAARATFLSAVTHELKSPIAAIRLFLETIDEDRVDGAKRRDLVRKMLLDTSRLERLVADLLRAGQIEADALVPAREDVDLAALAADVVETLRARLGPDDRLELAPAGPLTVPADPTLVRGAIENLVENAIQYSSAPRRIEVSVRTEGREAVLEVLDAGPGIEAALAGRAFEPFQRGGSEETRSAKGTGLGLFNVRGIAEAHGGRAFAGDRGGRPGTRAGLALPLGVEGP